MACGQGKANKAFVSGKKVFSHGSLILQVSRVVNNSGLPDASFQAAPPINQYKLT
jgi:hypothetical protein